MKRFVLLTFLALGVAQANENLVRFDKICMVYGVFTVDDENNAAASQIFVKNINDKLAFHGVPQEEDPLNCKQPSLDLYIELEGFKTSDKAITVYVLQLSATAENYSGLTFINIWRSRSFGFDSADDLANSLSDTVSNMADEFALAWKEAHP